MEKNNNKDVDIKEGYRRTALAAKREERKEKRRDDVRSGNRTRPGRVGSREAILEDRWSGLFPLSLSPVGGSWSWGLPWREKLVSGVRSDPDVSLG